MSNIRIRHLNCGTMCPWCERFFTGQGSLRKPARLVCHCLSIETPKGVILVDTGFGMQDVEQPEKRLGAAFVKLMNSPLRAEETALRQLQAAGHRAENVLHIVPTHLDPDHAGGLSDFPDASVHVYKPELNQLTDGDIRSRLRFKPAQFAHRPKWITYTEANDAWFGLPAIRIVPEMDVEMYLVPLVGHTRGHCGIAVKNGERWLLHCGDAYYHASQLLHPQDTPAGIRIFQTLVQTMPGPRVRSLQTLMKLAREHGDEIDFFCAHDPNELERQQRAS